MIKNPSFPDFKPLTLSDRAFFVEALRVFQPGISELNFTNLFIWRAHHGISWATLGNQLLLVCEENSGAVYGLPPIGPGDRTKACRALLGYLEKKKTGAAVERADSSVAREMERAGFLVEAERDQFDYVYKSLDLIALPGRKYHNKKNPISRLRRTRAFEYAILSESHVRGCLDVADAWCGVRRCEEDLNLSGELVAIREAFSCYSALDLTGGAILVEGKVAAFSFGEKLNDDTVVIHIEKANPAIPELYAVMNQQFAEHAWSGVSFINREQDLGNPGLRKAKQSYFPDHLVEKFRIRPAGG